jgi:hypothetical protein
LLQSYEIVTFKQNCIESKETGTRWEYGGEGGTDKGKSWVLLHNVAAHNVNVTRRVCYLT